MPPSCAIHGDALRFFASTLTCTGGTCDNAYDEFPGRLDLKDTHVHEMLRLGRCRLELAVRTLMMIDSLDMTEADPSPSRGSSSPATWYR